MPIFNIIGLLVRMEKIFQLYMCRGGGGGNLGHVIKTHINSGEKLIQACEKPYIQACEKPYTGLKN